MPRVAVSVRVPTRMTRTTIPPTGAASNVGQTSSLPMSVTPSSPNTSRMLAALVITVSVMPSWVIRMPTAARYTRTMPAVTRAERAVPTKSAIDVPSCNSLITSWTVRAVTMTCRGSPFSSNVIGFARRTTMTRPSRMLVVNDGVTTS